MDLGQRRKLMQERFRVLSPHEIHMHLNEHVVGQDHIKKQLAVALYTHCLRILHETAVPVQKSNVLMVGPTGVGKTLLAQSMASILDLPFVITDATTITESGYVGDDAEVLVEKLLRAADYDIAKAEVGIIYVDEIDKKARRNDMASLSRDVSGEGVQQSLLKLMEGTTVMVANKPNQVPEKVEVDTSNILFIVGGAFVGLDKIVENRIGKRSIGFTAGVDIKKDYAWADHLETGDLVKFGLIPEFCGRLPSVNVLHDLDRNHLLRILQEPKFSITKQYKALFDIEHVNIEFNKAARDAIVDTAIEQELGARGLRKIVDKALVDILYELPNLAEQGVISVIITDQVIRGTGDPMLIKRPSANQ